MKKINTKALFLDAVEMFFAEKGVLTSRGFSYRLEQQKYAQDVARWLIGERPIGLIEAETGIGKTFGALVPLILFWGWKKEKVCFSTYTLLLQRQIIETELGLLSEIMASEGFPFPKVARRVGAQQYVCLNRIERRRFEIFKDANPSNIWKRFENWAINSSENESGLLEDWFENYSNELPHDLCPEDVCLLSGEKYRSDAYDLSKKDIKHADLVITSHASLLVEATKPGSLFNTVDEPFVAIVFDEADKFSEVAKSFFCKRIQPRKISSWVKTAVGKKSLVDKTLGQLSQLETELNSFDDGSDVHICKSIGSTNIDELLIEQLTELEKSLTKVKSCTSVKDGYSTEVDYLEKYVGNFLLDISSTEQKALRAISYSPKNRVCALATYKDKPGSIHRVFLKQGTKTLFTSATISDGCHRDESFNSFKASMFVKSTELEVCSVYHPHNFGDMRFRFPNKHLCQIFDGEGNYNSEWVDSTENAIEKAYGEGNTLVLAGSFAEAEMFSSRLRDRVPVILHEKGESVRSCIDRFVECGGVLISPSLWEGHSIRNEDGSQAFDQLIETRVPFPPPNQAESDLFVYSYLKAKPNADKSEAEGIYIMLSMLTGIKKARQGIGRLLRAANDKGVVWFCDPRFPPSISSLEKDTVRKKGVIPILSRIVSRRFALAYNEDFLCEQKQEEEPMASIFMLRE